MTFWYGSGSEDSGFQDAKQKISFDFLITFWKIKMHKDVKKQQNQGCSYFFCLMKDLAQIRIRLNNDGSGSGRPKNLQIRIHNIGWGVAGLFMKNLQVFRTGRGRVLFYQELLTLPRICIVFYNVRYVSGSVSSILSRCQSRNCPGFDPSILRYSGIWGAADEAVLSTNQSTEKYVKIPL